MNVPTQALIVGAAGFVGAIARFAVAAAFGRLGLTFPLGTLVINVIGSFALGLLLGWGAARGSVPQPAQLAIGVGFLGAFTTFSTFATEGDGLLRDGHTPVALAYIALSVALGLGAARVGFLVMR